MESYKQAIPFKTVEQAIKSRNKAWQDCTLIPKWVNQAEVELDCFYTHPDVAKMCAKSLYSTMEDDCVNLNRYHFIDPGAGTGAFYSLMPKGRRTGIDILPSRLEFVDQDYLTWSPPNANYQYAVLGNPPFGYRAWLSLAFVNHSAIFADYIGFILPMAFQSEGKGSPKHRVRGAELILSELLPPNAFVDERGNVAKLNALWQIWRRGINRMQVSKSCNNWIDLFTVDTRKERLCGQSRMKEADYFLQRTFYGDPPRLVRDFSEVRYACGYGLIIKKERDKVIKLLSNTDWYRYSNLALHNCRHISMYHIRQAVIDGGFIDG